MRAWVTAMMWMAWLSWRLPVRFSRWRCCLPDEASSGADAGVERELGVGLKAVDVGDLGDDASGDDRAAPGHQQQLRGVAADHWRELAPQRVDPAGQVAQSREVFAGDPHRDARVAGGPAPVDALDRLKLAERAVGRLELRVEVVQQPPQPL